MITVLVAAKRRQGMSLEDFTQYWMNVHAPLVKSVPEFMRHLKRYVIYPLNSSAYKSELVLGRPPDYDGIGELRFESVETMKLAFDEPRYIEIIRPDEHKFLDRDACLTFVTEEKIQFES